MHYIYILLYIIFYNQTWQWKIHYDYTRIIILISIDDCPIKTSICGEFSIAIFDYQRIHILLSSWAYQNQSPCFRLRFVGRTCGLSHRRWCLKYVQIISICTLFLHHKNLCANFHHHFLAVGPIWPRHPAHSMQIANAIARKPAVLGGDHEGSTSLWGSVLEVHCHWASATRIPWRVSPVNTGCFWVCKLSFFTNGQRDMITESFSDVDEL